MKYRIAISVVVAALLALTAMPGIAGQGKGGGGSVDRTQQMDRDRTYDRDSVQDRDRIRVPDQDRDRDRVHRQDPMSMSDADIYGGELMTAEERNQYRKQLKSSKSAKAREQMQAQHEKRMQERALEQGKDLVPPGQGKIYGGELMSVQERNAYRERLRLYDTEEGVQKFQAQHREEMQKRAAALGRDIEEAP